MSRFRPGRPLGVTAGALLILALGLYGPATLLGPLPPMRQILTAPAAAVPESAPPALPSAGGSAITVTGSDLPLAVAGSAGPLPMASAAKIVTALVVLDSRPLKPDGAGPTVVISSEDYRNYIDFGTSDARTVAVFPGETWTQRELLEAMILGSSNNHAETLARWAFGSAEGYLDAAGRWLHTNGLTGTDVVDATGLSDASAGTATDLAHLAGLASTNPIISDILANPASALTSRRGVNNTTSYLPEEGVTGISRSYTDAAGVCFLFSARIGDGDDAFTFSGAFIGEPDHDTLETDVLALMGSAREGVHDQPILAEGDPYALLETAWGERTAAVVGVTKSQVGWQTGARDDVQVAVEDIRTGRAGKPVGRVATTIDGETVSAPLVLEKTIRDPGPGWRLLNPVPLISALVESSR